MTLEFTNKDFINGCLKDNTLIQNYKYNTCEIIFRGIKGRINFNHLMHTKNVIFNFIECEIDMFELFIDEEHFNVQIGDSRIIILCTEDAVTECTANLEIRLLDSDVNTFNIQKDHETLFNIHMFDGLCVQFVTHRVFNSIELKGDMQIIANDLHTGYLSVRNNKLIELFTVDKISGELIFTECKNLVDITIYTKLDLLWVYMCPNLQNIRGKFVSRLGITRSNKLNVNINTQETKLYYCESIVMNNGVHSLHVLYTGSVHIHNEFVNLVYICSSINFMRSIYSCTRRIITDNSNDNDIMCLPLFPSIKMISLFIDDAHNNNFIHDDNIEVRDIMDVYTKGIKQRVRSPGIITDITNRIVDYVFCAQ